MGSGTMAGGFDGWLGASQVGGTGGSGAQGAQGFQGAVGAAGAQGGTGVQGFQGAAGAAGAQGGTGAQGFQGAAGAAGAQGSQGSQGTQGAQGSQGLPAAITVANSAALGALAAGGLGDGTLAYVQSYQANFQLVASTQPVAANVRVAASGNAGHLWVRVLESSAWWSQLTWYVDPSNSSGTASDENTGASNVLPLATFAELGRRFLRRWLPGSETNSYTVNQLSNAVANDYAQFHLDPFYRGASINAILTGTVTAVAVGTVASAVAKNAATNTANSITVTGFDFSTHIGQNIRIVGTPTTTAVIEAAPSLGVAQLGEQSVNGTVGAGFVATNVVEIASLTTLQGIVGTGRGVSLQINDTNLNGAATAINTDTPGLLVIAKRCQFSGGGQLPAGLNHTACSFVGAWSVYGENFGTCSSLVNCTMLLSGIGTSLAGQARHHWASCGMTASALTLDDGQVLRIDSDLHAFATAANTAAVLQRPGSLVYHGGNYYGSGNAASSCGIQQVSGCRWFLGFIPTMDATLAYVSDTGGIPSTGVSTAFTSCPYPGVDALGFGRMTKCANGTFTGTG